MKARNVLLAMIIIAAGMTVTAARRGVFAHWERTLRDLAKDIEEAVGVVAESRPTGEWQVAMGGHSSEFSGRKFSSLIIENANGNVTVTGWDQDKVRISDVKYGRGETRQEIGRNASMAYCYREPSGDTLVVSVRGRDEWWKRARIDLQITTPPNLDVKVRTTSGTAQVRGTNGAVQVENVSGDSSVKGGREAQIRSISGAVGLENVSGETRLSTISGSIRASNLRGPLSAKAISGDIILDNYAGSPADLRTTSGRLDASLSQPVTGQFSAHSVSGPISLAIPRVSDCIVDLSSTSGDVRISGLSLAPGGSSGRHYVRGLLGAGTGRLELGTISGSVTVTGKSGVVHGRPAARPRLQSAPVPPGQRLGILRPPRRARPSPPQDPRH